MKDRVIADIFMLLPKQFKTYRLDLGASLSEALKGLLRAGYSQEYLYVQDDGSTGGLIDTQLSLAETWGEVFSTLDLLFSLGLNGILPSDMTEHLMRQSHFDNYKGDKFSKIFLGEEI